LLAEVAAKINDFTSSTERREMLHWSRMLAGLRYDKNLISNIFKESDMLEESVIYQDILQKGERKIVRNQLEYRFGKLSETVLAQFEQLVIRKVEALGKALLDFKTQDDLTLWLEENAPARRKKAKS
jgi:predicted transposase YdaD